MSNPAERYWAMKNAELLQTMASDHEDALCALHAIVSAYEASSDGKIPVAAIQNARRVIKNSGAEE